MSSVFRTGFVRIFGKKAGMFSAYVQLVGKEKDRELPGLRFIMIVQIVGFRLNASAGPIRVAVQTEA